MEKYLRMKNPPNVVAEIKIKFLYIFDILAFGVMFMLTKQVNTLFQLKIGFAVLNYILAFFATILLIMRPTSNPGQRMISVIIESFLNKDTNRYHAIDQTVNYHASGKEMEEIE